MFEGNIHIDQSSLSSTSEFDEIIQFIRNQFVTEEGCIPLHEPKFIGREVSYVTDAIESTYVSSVGRYVDQFEEMVSEYTGSRNAVAVVNGTSALHVALKLLGVNAGDEVITQPLTFVATANAISYTGAQPLFVDVDRDTMGLSPQKLRDFLNNNLFRKNGDWYNKASQKRISACIPMHTFGLPARIDEIVEICNQYEIPVIEDSAESLGSTYKSKHTGTFGKLGIFSLNGNKIITCGGGGVIITDDDELAQRAKHITTTAKIKHRWEYVHDEIGYNYRLPNLNAAMACAQMEMLDSFIAKKRHLTDTYRSFFKDKELSLAKEINGARSNCWLNALILNNREQRDRFLSCTNDREVMTRPIWRLLNKLEMFRTCFTANLDNAEWLEDRVVNIPSSVIVNGNE